MNSLRMIAWIMVAVLLAIVWHILLPFPASLIPNMLVSLYIGYYKIGPLLENVD